MIDTVLRALRDRARLLVEHLKRAWKQNWRQSLVPGALFGPVCGQLGWMLRAQALAGNTSTALWVASLAGIFVCTGFFQLAAGAGAAGGSAAAPACQKRRADVLRLLPRTLAAALVLAVYWGLTLLYLPATILTILAFGFWLPVTVAGMILYPGLDKVFRLEETLAPAAMPRSRNGWSRTAPTSTINRGEPVWIKNTVLLRDTEAFMRGELDNVTVAQNSIVLDLVQGSYVPLRLLHQRPAANAAV